MFRWAESTVPKASPTCMVRRTLIKIDTRFACSYNPFMIKHMFSVIVVASGCVLLTISCTYTSKSTSDANDKPISVADQLASGGPIYTQTCATSACHGTQGEGIKSGQGFKAWPLVGDEFQSRHPNAQ